MDGKAIGALIFAGFMLGVYLWAKRKGREQEAEGGALGEDTEAQRPSATLEPFEVEWWTQVWGVEHGDVLPVGDDQQMIYDWKRAGDHPPIYVGAGRGHRL